MRLLKAELASSSHIYIYTLLSIESIQLLCTMAANTTALTATIRCSLNLFTKTQLRDGNFFPIFGLGTWRAEKNDCKNAVIDAVNLGYRLLDTASCYENEQEIGQAVKQCGIPRDELFITGKLWTPDHGMIATKTAFNQSLKK